MLVIISFLLPSIITIQLERLLIKEPQDKINLLLNYGIYVLINNTLTTIIMIMIFNIKTNIIDNILLYPAVMVRYTFISSILALIIGYIKIIIKKNVGIEIESKNKKNN